MHLPAILTVAALAADASASLLYVSSYSGNITTLNLTGAPNEKYNLALVASTPGCAPNASYIVTDLPNLYCLDENIVGANGSLVSFKVDAQSGIPSKVANATTLGAPVHASMWSGMNGTKQLLAVAHYAWGLSTWEVDHATATFKLAQSFNFTQAKPGPNAERQAAPHPHQVLVEPMRMYLVIPDLGSDLIRIFYIDPMTLKVSERPSIPVEPGSGPRHGAFIHYDMHNVKYYLVSELGNKLTSYDVNYLPNNGGLAMTRIMSMKTYGNNTASAFAGNAASEIVIAGSKQLIVSNRNATYFQLNNPCPKNATKIPSDTMATFSLPESMDGTFTFGRLSPAGGSFPRHFSMNKARTMIAVGLQKSESVVVYSYSKKTGVLGDKPLAMFKGLGPVTSVVWGK